VTTKSRAELILLATTLIWGGTFTVVKVGMEDISPILLTGIRFLVGTVAVLAINGRELFPLSKPQIVRGTLLGLILFLGFVAQNIGLTITTASKSAFITGMMVLFVPILQFIIERRAPRPANVVGVLIVAAGLWFLTSPSGASFNAGDGLTVACAILFALYIVYLDVVSRDMTTAQLTFLQMASTAVYSFVAVALWETPVLHLTGQSLLALAYLTFLATILTTYVQTRYQKETTPTRAAVIFSVEPVFASIIAWLALGEQMGDLGVLGGALILSGVLVSEFSESIPFLRGSLDGEESES
jgi:drug/metabolite transporter (DMT)-like permease